MLFEPEGPSPCDKGVVWLGDLICRSKAGRQPAAEPFNTLPVLLYFKAVQII